MNEKTVQEKLAEKGYKFFVQFQNKETGEIFGDPIGFKSSLDIGPFLRENSELSLVSITKVD